MEIKPQTTQTNPLPPELLDRTGLGLAIMTTKIHPIVTVIDLGKSGRFPIYSMDFNNDTLPQLFLRRLRDNENISQFNHHFYNISLHDGCLKDICVYRPSLQNCLQACPAWNLLRGH
jgi:hypothetical protein